MKALVFSKALEDLKAPDGAEPMAAADEKDRSTRDKSANSNHFACVIFSSVDIQFDCKLAKCFSDPMCQRLWHWLENLKCPDGGCDLAFETSRLAKKALL